MRLPTTLFSILLLAQLLFTASLVCAQKPGDPIPGAFILQLFGTCNGRCRGELQSALASSPETPGCTFMSAGIPIGTLDYETIQCPPGGKTTANALFAALASQLQGQADAVLQRVEEDGVVSFAAASTALWGVDEADGGVSRDDGGEPVRDSSRTCSMSSNNGEGVTVWILDSGCEPTLNGKCVGFAGGKLSERCRDGNGHGTHVGGTATDETFGVAPRATRACVKVLNNKGSGSWSDVIGAISFVTQNSGEGANGDVINMSLGGPRTESVNDAVEAAAAAGVYFSLSAGNSAANACTASPASATGAKVFTVAAHNIALQSASFSNFGTSADNCVQLSAPGVDIESTKVRGGSVLYSGTSMAAPHVAGACALLLSDGLVPTVDRLTAGGVAISRESALDQFSLGVTTCLA